jgi:hypothetical protein
MIAVADVDDAAAQINADDIAVAISHRKVVIAAAKIHAVVIAIANRDRGGIGPLDIVLANVGDIAALREGAITLGNHDGDSLVVNDSFT